MKRMTKDRAFGIYKSNPPFVNITDCYIEHMGWVYQVIYNGESYGHCLSARDGIHVLKHNGIITEDMAEYWSGYYNPYSKWYREELWQYDRKQTKGEK